MGRGAFFSCCSKIGLRDQDFQDKKVLVFKNNFRFNFEPDPYINPKMGFAIFLNYSFCE